MDDDMIMFIVGIFMGMFVLGFIWLGIHMTSFNISQETGDDICKQLTGNETTIAEDDGYGNLICELPSYDETQHIIIRSNSE